ncbi:type II toxin-antitoxin system RelE/ParE family toxin [uncultured Zhongshania sp.]|uniref:type II toxin-antitoxin system RelE/ParE family toxin n=1 Tax=uncultured Zhongshania sp. TaxID=1642288 RepID=UPI0030DC1B7E
MYKLSNKAVDDFTAIYEYTLLNFGVAQADTYTEHLESSFRMLSISPLMGHAYPEIADDVRRHDHQSHAVFYRQREHDIFIIRILHQQMEPMKYFTEL